MIEFFEDVKLLTSFIGCNIFDVVVQKDRHLFYTKYRGCDAKGFYSENGFTVIKGSKIANTSVPSLIWKEKRKKEIELYTSFKNKVLILNNDRTFSSPSTAADFCIGSSNNGWNVWKDKSNKSLDEVYRKQLK